MRHPQTRPTPHTSARYEALKAKHWSHGTPQRESGRIAMILYALLGALYAVLVRC